MAAEEAEEAIFDGSGSESDDEFTDETIKASEALQDQKKYQTYAMQMEDNFYVAHAHLLDFLEGLQVLKYTFKEKAKEYPDLVDSTTMQDVQDLCDKMKEFNDKQAKEWADYRRTWGALHLLLTKTLCDIEDEESRSESEEEDEGEDGEDGKPHPEVRGLRKVLGDIKRLVKDRYNANPPCPAPLPAGPPALKPIRGLQKGRNAMFDPATRPFPAPRPLPAPRAAGAGHPFARRIAEAAKGDAAGPPPDAGFLETIYWQLKGQSKALEENDESLEGVRRTPGFDMDSLD